MKTLIFTLALAYLTAQEIPVGVWMYKQDSSKIELFNKDGTISGTLISSKNPSNEPGTEIFKNFKFKNGKWQGELYLIKVQQWVDASFQLKENLLLVEYNYGFLAKSFYLLKENHHK